MPADLTHPWGGSENMSQVTLSPPLGAAGSRLQFMFPCRVKCVAIEAMPTQNAFTILRSTVLCRWLTSKSLITPTFVKARRNSIGSFHSGENGGIVLVA